MPEARDNNVKIVAGIAAVLLVAVAVEFSIGRRRDKSPELKASPFSMNMPAPSESMPQAPAPSEAGSSLIAPQSGPSFGDFMSAIRARLASAPQTKQAAETARKEFMAQPELKAIYEEFRESAEAGDFRSADEFVSKLEQKREFHSLINNVGSSADGPMLFSQLAKDPMLGSMLRKVSERASAAARAGRGFSAVLSAGGAGTGPAALPNSVGAAPATGAVPQPRGAQVSGGGAASMGGSHAGGSGAGGGAGRADGVGSGGSPSGPPSKGEGGPAFGAHIVSPHLDQTFKDEPASEKVKALLARYPCLQSLGQSVVQEMITSNLIESYGLWGGCFASRRYGACKRAGCTAPMSGWDACKDWKGPGPGTDAICRTECAAQRPDCELPDDPKITEMWIPTGPRDQVLASYVHAENHDRIEAHVCHKSGACDAPSRGMPSCPSWGVPDWSGRVQVDVSWTPGTYGGGCCFEYEVRACKGALCSGWQPSGERCFP